MRERFIEIKFYYYCLNLLKKLNYTVNILDLIDTYCLLSDADSSIIKLLLKQIREGRSRLKPYKEEATYIARQLGLSYSVLQDIAGISKATQSRLKEKMKDRDYLYQNVTAKLGEREYIAVEKFMSIVDKLKEI
jgi:hypothetical protein